MFAAIYYDPSNKGSGESFPAYRLAPGEAESDHLGPAGEGNPLVVELRVVGGPIDVYVMDAEWASTLPRHGGLDLSRPFSHHAAWSKTNVEGELTLTLLSDGVTAYVVVFDNSDNFYDGDAQPDPGSATGGVVSVEVTTHYVEERDLKLLLGYLAVIPAVLLVAATAWRRARRRRRQE